MSAWEKYREEYLKTKKVLDTYDFLPLLKEIVQVEGTRKSYVIFDYVEDKLREQKEMGVLWAWKEYDIEEKEDYLRDRYPKDLCWQEECYNVIRFLR